MKPEDVISILDVALGADESGNAADQLKGWRDAGDYLAIEAKDGSTFCAMVFPRDAAVQVAPSMLAARALLEIHGKARPRASYVGGPMVEYVIDKKLIDSLREIIAHLKGAGVVPRS